MRSDVRLDSAVFQLTPTRTRCDLVIIANGKSEKIASGLLNPFLAHLKTAQDQTAKGGYSITLQPDLSFDAFWFTKGTVERFVRFVSTPEILERVATIESEILQIDEAITIQGNENLGSTSLEDHNTKSPESSEGIKPASDADSDKAIVLYKPGSNTNAPESNGSASQEENSKVQLLRVLEARKIVLQKEQGMAFARATAAGFDIDHMTHLVTFAECFGAARLKTACLKFMELWRVKHETGQWFEVEADALSMRSGFSPFNASGIVLAADASRNDDIEDNGNTANSSSDKRLPSDTQQTPGPHGSYPGQFQHPAYPPWAMHPPPYQPYPMHGMPYYQNYPQGGPFYPPYPHPDDPHFNSGQRIRRRHSMNGKDDDVNSENSSMSAEEDEVRSLSENERELSHDRKSHRRSSRSGKKKSGMVVIKNLNYITSNKHEKSEDESKSASDTEINISNKKSSKSSLSKNFDGDDMMHGNDAESGNWQAFQSFLLKAEEKITSSVDGDMFANEKEPSVKRKQNILSEPEPFVTSERNSNNSHEARIMEFDSVNGNGNRIRIVGSNDEMLASSEIERGMRETHLDSQFIEIESGSGNYRKMDGDDFMIYGRGSQTNTRSSLDPLAENMYDRDHNLENKSYAATDESFIVPNRSHSLDQFESENRTHIDMDTELPSRKEDSSNNNTNNQVSYEPDELFMMPERGNDTEYVSYDPVDYDMEMPIEAAAKQESAEQEDASEKNVEETKKTVKNKKVKDDSLEKRRREAMMRRGMNTKSSSLTEAQKRAEKLRAYKADLQKEKKANEEEARKRLESLKLERQKRIAARTNSNSVQSPKAKKHINPNPFRAPSSSSNIIKFSDSEPGINSPRSKVPVRNTSSGSANSPKATKTSKQNGTTDGITKSVSSLSQANSITAHTKRLSEPNIRNSQSQKSTTNEKVPKKVTTNGPQMKKITAIKQLDKTKSATLPELKIMPSKDPSDNEAKKNKPSASNSDENPVVEKTVVMLENTMVNEPVSESAYLAKVKSGTDLEYAAIRAPPSPIIAAEIYEVEEKKADLQLDSFEVADNISKEPYDIPNTVTENSYQAPYARASSIEKPASGQLENEQPTIESELASIRAQSIKARVPDFPDSGSVNQSTESIDKPKSKESKGFRKLLKFGRKSHSSGTGEIDNDSDGSVVDDQVEAGSSNDVHMLKNMISQDDAQAGGSQTKANRAFSILSPFRGSKSNEKKPVA